MKDYKFEIDQLRYDNSRLQDNFDKEKQVTELTRKMYNRAVAREFEDAQC